MDETWTPLYFGGQNNKTVYRNNVAFSDWTDFDFDEKKDYLVTFYWVDGPLCFGIEPETNSYVINNSDYSQIKDWEGRGEEHIAQWVHAIEARYVENQTTEPIDRKSVV